jgi:hypothetical protein
MRVLNLGAGVQPTTLALMSQAGEIEPFDFAVFADTQAEPSAVYDHLDWLIRQLTFPVLIRTQGDLGANLRSGMHGDGGRCISIPAFTGAPGNNTGIMRRQCTAVYKVDVVERAIRRDLLSLKVGEKIPQGIAITQIFGLSFDEPSRVARVRSNHSRKLWSVEFPLFDLEMTRADCVSWLDSYGVPHETPRSACTFCPFRSNAEWRKMKMRSRKDFESAVEIDDMLRDPESRASKGLDSQLWLHRSCRPLKEIDFESMPVQAQFDFDFECEGMCGV